MNGTHSSRKSHGTKPCAVRGQANKPRGRESMNDGRRPQRTGNNLCGCLSDRRHFVGTGTFDAVVGADREEILCVGIESRDSSGGRSHEGGVSVVTAACLACRLLSIVNEIAVHRGIGRGIPRKRDRGSGIGRPRSPWIRTPPAWHLNATTVT